MARTLFEKLWDAHVVRAPADQPTLLYIDLHLVHEVTSPQAFEGLRVANRRVRRPDLTVATVDHNVPTTDRSLPIADPIGAKQINTLRQNCLDFGIQLFDINSAEQGIVHVIGPELGLTQPGKISIVYSNQKEVPEYLEYIEFLKNKNILKPDVEFLELEELQGVTGMKALRVDINIV